MSDYDRNLRGPENQYRVPLAGWGSGTWIAGAVIAVLLLFAIGYVFSDRAATNSSMVEHRAAATDTTAPAAAPVMPMNTPAAAATPSANPEAAPKP